MKKRKWKRYISLMLVVVMAVSMFMGKDIVTAATDISNVNVTVKPKLLLAGSTFTEDEYNETSNVTVASGDYSVESLTWKDGFGNPLVDGDQLQIGAAYKVEIILKVNGDASFAHNVTGTVNGENLEAYKIVESSADEIKLEWDFSPQMISDINRVELTGVPVVEPGVQAADYSYTHNEGGTDQYTVTGTWLVYEEATQQYQPMASNEVFQENGSYQLNLNVKTEPGYVFNNPEVTVNGSYVNTILKGDFECSSNCFYSFGTRLDVVEFSVAEPVEGQIFSNATPIEATVPAGSPYTVKGNWRDVEGDLAGTFTKGKAYFFDCTIYAANGYHFAEDVFVGISNDYEYCSGWTKGNGKTASFTFRKSFADMIDEAILLNVPKPELGMTLQDDPFPIEVPTDAKYQAQGRWLDESGNPITNRTVAVGESYILQIELIALPGYEFATECILNINGIEHRGVGGNEMHIYSIDYSFKEQIEQAEVLGVIEPVEGQIPSTDTLQVADPTKYEILNAVWIDVEDGAPATMFEKNHVYELRLILNAKPGCEFVPYALWKVGDETGYTVQFADTLLKFSIMYSLETVIPEVQISNIPTVKVGESARTDISVPADANYTARAEWYVWNESKKMYEPFAGTFEQGKNYGVRIVAIANAGYCVEQGSTAFYLDGVLQDDVDARDGMAVCRIDFPVQGDKIIQKIEINIEKPVAGNHTSVPPVITLPENATYTQGQNSFVEWMIGDVQTNQMFRGYFATDGSYGVVFSLYANEGYVFAKDLVVMVNGILLPEDAYVGSCAKEVNARYFFDMACQHRFGTEWKFDGTGHWHVCDCGAKADEGTHSGGTATLTNKAICTVCGQEYGELAAGNEGNETGDKTKDESKEDSKVISPKTSDSSEMIVWIVLLIIGSGVVIMTSAVSRKRRKTRN